MDKKMLSVKTVVAIGIGAALMFVLNRFVAIPTGVPNLSFQLGMAILAVFAAIFGPVAGFLIGFIGHTLVDLTWGGMWWSWIISSALLGLIIGYFWKFYKMRKGHIHKKVGLYTAPPRHSQSDTSGQFAKLRKIF